MFDETITLFNRRGDEWYPTVIEGVQLNTDRGSITARYGRECEDRAVLLAPYADDDVVAGKTYLEPKKWRRLDEPGAFITFAGGEDFDFFLAGAWEGAGPVDDADFPRGFYDHMNRARDGVYAVTSVSKFNTIPHLEVTGR